MEFRHVSYYTEVKQIHFIIIRSLDSFCFDRGVWDDLDDGESIYYEEDPFVLGIEKYDGCVGSLFSGGRYIHHPQVYSLCFIFIFSKLQFNASHLSKFCL